MAGHVYLRLVFIGSLCGLSLLRLAVVIDLILVRKPFHIERSSPVNQVKPVINEFLTSVSATVVVDVVVWVLCLIRKNHDKRSIAK